MINVLICDDDAYTLRMLEHLVRQIPQITSVVTVSSGEDAIKAVQSSEMHIVLMDIDLPKLDGMETSKVIRGIMPDAEIVFITAYPDYALDSYSVLAADYITKPIDIERMKACIVRLINELETSRIHESITRNDLLFIKTKSDIYFVDEKDLYFIEKQGKKLVIHLKSEIIETYMGLRELENKLTNNFFRTHKSYLINLRKVYKVSQFSESSFVVHFRDIEQTALITKEKFNHIKEL